MALNITNLYYTEENIGLNLHISKRQFVWGFDLDRCPQHIKLLDSRLSHKKRLYRNGEKIYYVKEKGNFNHTFQIDGHTCVIIQYADKIELRIDNESFTHLYNLQKNKELLKKDSGPTSKIYINNNFNTISYSQEEDNKNDSVFFKNNKPKEEKPKLFNFKIKKENGNKIYKINNKFLFGEKNKKKFESTLSNNDNNKQNNSNIENINKQKKDLLCFQDDILNSNKKNKINFDNNKINFNDSNKNKYNLLDKNNNIDDNYIQFNTIAY